MISHLIFTVTTFYVWAMKGAVAPDIYSSVDEIKELAPKLYAQLNVNGRKTDRVQPSAMERVTNKRATQYMRDQDDEEEHTSEEDEDDANTGPDQRYMIENTLYRVI
jgi:hypothetical protein